MVVADLATTHMQSLNLDFTPDRLLVSPDGAKLAVVEAASGRIAVIDLASAKQTARIGGLPPLVDVMFSSAVTGRASCRKAWPNAPPWSAARRCCWTSRSVLWTH
ncbi:MAG TPA: hypothetical protein VK558_11360 [Patescibacteria group bacterium]|nr:hypothetical protein [Patescibacteria group bacterium]